MELRKGDSNTPVKSGFDMKQCSDFLIEKTPILPWACGQACSLGSS